MICQEVLFSNTASEIGDLMDLGSTIGYVESGYSAGDPDTDTAPSAAVTMTFHDYEVETWRSFAWCKQSELE